MLLAEKELRAKQFRMVWDLLGCFRPFDVRLLFGPFGTGGMICVAATRQQ